MQFSAFDYYTFMEFGRIWMIEKCLKMHSGIRYEQKSHTFCITCNKWLYFRTGDILKIINLGAYDFPLWGYNTTLE